MQLVVPTTSMQNIIKVSTIVSSMQAFKGVATDSQVWERISVAAEELQPAERTGVQLL